VSHRTLTTDVVVVGAGPAGTAAAICCAQAGLDVTILEREAFPRDRPGETLHPGVEVLLRRLGVLAAVSSAGFLRHEGICVRWEGTSRFAAYGADRSGLWLGYQAWRADLDGILLARACELGASRHQPCRAVRPLVARGRVCGVETSQGRVLARLVVDAAGAQHWLARQRAIGLVRRSPRLVARYGYCLMAGAKARACGSADDRERRSGDSQIGASPTDVPAPAPILAADEDGWTWIAQVTPRLYTWTSLPLHARRTDPGRAPHALRGLEPHGQTRGADLSWRALADPAGPGYVAVGDAAAVLDPSSSHGVLKALLSGEAAADLAVKVLRQPAYEAQAIEHYTARVMGLFETDVSELRRLYARLPHPPSWALEAGTVGGLGSRA